MSRDLCWHLVHTRPRAEAWVEINLRKSGFTTMLPRLRQRSGFAPLYPRYVLAGCGADASTEPLGRTPGVVYVVHVGETPARVPAWVIARLQACLDAHGVVHLEDGAANDPLFAPQRRERVHALLRAARAHVPTDARALNRHTS